MVKLQFSCFDILLCGAVLYAISDCINNWEKYATCSVPLDVYIVVSVATLLLFRICNFMGIKIATGDYLSGGQNQQENEQPS